MKIILHAPKDPKSFPKIIYGYQLPPMGMQPSKFSLLWPSTWDEPINPGRPISQYSFTYDRSFLCGGPWVKTVLACLVLPTMQEFSAWKPIPFWCNIMYPPKKILPENYWDNIRRPCHKFGDFNGQVHLWHQIVCGLHSSAEVLKWAIETGGQNFSPSPSPFPLL